MVKANNNKVEYTKAQLLALANEGKVCKIFETYEEARDYVIDDMDDDIEAVEQVNESVEVYKSVDKKDYAKNTYISAVTTADGEVIYEVVIILPMDFLYIGDFEPGNNISIRDILNYVYYSKIEYNDEDYYYTEDGLVITDVDAERAADVAELWLNDELEGRRDYDFDELNEVYLHNSDCIDEQDAFILTYMGKYEVEQRDYEDMVGHGLKLVLTTTNRKWNTKLYYDEGFGDCTMCSEALADVIAEREYRYA